MSAITMCSRTMQLARSTSLSLRHCKPMTLVSSKPLLIRTLSSSSSSFPSSTTLITLQRQHHARLGWNHWQQTCRCHTSVLLLRSSTLKEQQQLRTDTNEASLLLTPVYVHHVSKTVLQHLQEHHNTWICQHGLDRSLRINANGTFLLQFPAAVAGFDAGRIWTSYDTASKQHWLCVYRHKVVGRFLLKDGQKTVKASQVSAEGLWPSNTHIRWAVDQLIATLNQAHDEASKRGGCN